MVCQSRWSWVVCVLVVLLAAGCGGGGSSGKRNQPPTLTPIPTPQSVQEGSLLAFTVTATDPESAALALTAAPLPAGATFVDNGNGTGDFAFTPTASQVGQTFTVTFGVDDQANPPVTQDVDIQVTAIPNGPPVLAAIPTPQSVLPGDILTFVVAATDPDLDPITLAAAPLPANASFVDNGNGTGDFSFGPSAAQALQSFQIDFSADDGVNPPVSQTVQIDVGNRSPLLAPIATPQTAQEGVLHAFSVTATDFESDPLTLTAAPLPQGANFVDNGNGTGDFTFTPTPPQVGQTFTITFGVDDGINPAVTQNVDIDVIAFNAPPVLNPIATPRSVLQGANLAFQVSATDADLDPITLTAIPLPANATFVDNGNGTGDFAFDPDFVQSGRFDVTFAASDGINPPTSQVVRIDVSGGGFGTFSEITPAVPFGTEAWGLASGDLDGDGIADLAAPDSDSGGVGGTVGLVILLNNGSGVFSVSAESPYSLTGASADPIPRHLTIADFDNDGGNDVAIAARFDGDLHVFMGDMPAGSPDGTFTYNPAGYLDRTQDEIFHIVSGDLTGDGNVDLVTGGAAPGGNLRILLGNGAGAFTPSSQSPIQTSAAGGDPVHQAIGHIDGDGIPDIVAVNLADSAFYIYFGDDDGSGKNGNGTFTPGTPVTTPVGSPSQPSLADFNNDGYLDVAIPHFDATAAVFTIWLGDGAGSFVEATARPPLGVNAEYSGTGDFNGDGIPDLTASSSMNMELHVYLGAGDGTFNATTGSPFPLSEGGRAIAVDDYTNDGISDVAVVAQGTGTLHVFAGN